MCVYVRITTPSMSISYEDYRMAPVLVYLACPYITWTTIHLNDCHVVFNLPCSGRYLATFVFWIEWLDQSNQRIPVSLYP